MKKMTGVQWECYYPTLIIMYFGKYTVTDSNYTLSEKIGYFSF